MDSKRRRIIEGTALPFLALWSFKAAQAQSGEGGGLPPRNCMAEPKVASAMPAAAWASGGGT